MNTNWTRHLNPLHFEERSLKWGSWMNVVIACFLLPSAIALLTICRSVAARFADQNAIAADRLPLITDVSKLQKMLHDQLVYNQGQSSNAMGMVDGLGLLVSALFLASVLNAFYLFKAYQMLRRLASGS